MDIDLILENCEIPPFPLIASKIQQLANDPDTSIEDLQRAIMADQSFAVKVLTIANSAFYGLKRNVKTISEAILIMGFDAIKNLSLALACKDIYKTSGTLEHKLWEHALGVSVASGLIAKHLKHLTIKPEEAFVAGILHDVGKAAMDASQPEKFSLSLQQIYEEKIPSYLLEKELFGFTHADVGHVLLQKWGLPQTLSDVVLSHHGCQNINIKDNEINFNLCNIVCMADALCLRLGVGLMRPMPELAYHDYNPNDSLGFSEDDIEKITELFKESYIKEKLLYID